jgi:hypothetical protein
LTAAGFTRVVVPALALAAVSCASDEADEPTAVLKFDGQIHSLAMDHESVFVSANSGGGGSQILAASKSGGRPRTLATADTYLGAIAVDEALVYCSLMGGGPFAVPKAGGEWLLVGTVSEQPYGVAVDAENVYWVTWLYQNEDYGIVARYSKQDGEIVALADNQLAPLRLAIDATHVYWTAGDAGEGGIVRKVPTGGGEVTTLATGASPQGFIALDDANVYFTVEGASELMAVPKRGGTAFVVATLQGRLGSLVADGESVYVSSTEGIFEVARDGSTVEHVSGSRWSLYGVAIDTDFVYWIGNSGVEEAVFRALR